MPPREDIVFQPKRYIDDILSINFTICNCTKIRNYLKSVAGGHETLMKRIRLEKTSKTSSIHAGS